MPYIGKISLAEVWSLAKKKFEPITKIGDIKITARRDMGDKWLLCNGDQIGDQYTELKTMIDNNLATPNQYLLFGGDATGDGFGNHTHEIIYADGVFCYIDGETNNLNFHTSTDLENWETLTRTDIDTSGNRILDFKYLNGKFVILAYKSSKTYAAYTAGSIDGTWPKTEFAIDGAADLKAKITYGDGYYYLLNYYGIYRATSFGGTWTQVARNFQGDSCVPGSIDYADGLVYARNYRSGYYSANIIVYDAEKNSSANLNYLSDDISGNITYAKDIGKLLFTTYENYNSAKRVGYYDRASTTFKNCSFAYEGTNTDISYAYGKIILKTSSGLYLYSGIESTDFEEKVSLPDGFSGALYAAPSESLRDHFNGIFLGGSNSDKRFLLPLKALPSVSVENGLYCYIKAKE